MRVGDSLEAVYVAPGPLPAGNYVARVGAALNREGARMRIELRGEHAGGGTSYIGAGEATLSLVDGQPDAGAATYGAAVTIPGAAATLACGDRLVLRATYLEGPEDTDEFALSLTTP